MRNYATNYAQGCAPGRTHAGRILILVLGAAWREEQRAVMAEQAGDELAALDHFARGRELRHEGGQHPQVISGAPDHARQTYPQWRKEVRPWRGSARTARARQGRTTAPDVDGPAAR